MFKIKRIEITIFYLAVLFLMTCFIRNYVFQDKEFKFGTFRVYEKYGLAVCYPQFFTTANGVDFTEQDRWLLLGYKNKYDLPRVRRVIENKNELNFQLEQICSKKLYSDHLRLSYFCGSPTGWNIIQDKVEVCHE